MWRWILEGIGSIWAWRHSCLISARFATKKTQAPKMAGLRIGTGDYVGILRIRSGPSCIHVDPAVVLSPISLPRQTARRLRRLGVKVVRLLILRRRSRHHHRPNSSSEWVVVGQGYLFSRPSIKTLLQHFLSSLVGNIVWRRTSEIRKVSNSFDQDIIPQKRVLGRSNKAGLASPLNPCRWVFSFGVIEPLTISNDCICWAVFACSRGIDHVTTARLADF
jgi:hypothetical protein